MDEPPSLSNLPVDLAARCLEFLPFDTVRGAKRGVKRVSRGLRSAARRALTRGRWRPIKQFAEASLFIKETMDSPDAVPAASIERYRAAWALEPGQVFFEVANWHGLSEPIAIPIARFLATWSRPSEASDESLRPVKPRASAISQLTMKKEACGNTS